MSLVAEIIAALDAWSEQMRAADAEQAQAAQSLAFQEQAALELGRRIASIALTHQLARLGTGYDRTSRPCACGRRQRFERYAPRTLRTLAGPVTLTRAYYRCRGCGASSFPLDERVGQSGREISAGVERVLALVAAHVSFATAERMLGEVAGVALSARQIEAVAEALGRQAEARQQRQEQAAATRALGEVAGPRRPEPRTWVVEMDGVLVGMQDGSWQEAKCGVLYELGQRARVQARRWELLERQRCVLRGEAAAFRRRLWALAVRAGVRAHDRVVVIGDGAEWIDQTVGQLFPGALRILDFYHASQRVWSVAAARWGEGAWQAKAWAEAKVALLKGGRVQEVVAAMRRLKPGRAEAEAVRGEAVRYLAARAGQMAYDRYQAEGLPIGSGAVESSCKLVVSARCKQAGMRWSEAGVDAMLQLRVWILNDRLDELCPKPQISIDWSKAA
jgi:hypothetical protein